MPTLRCAASCQGIRRYARDLGSAAPLRWLAHGENLAPYEAGQTLPDPNFAAPACHHVALLTPEALPRVGLSPAAKVLDLKGRLRCRGCGRKGRAVVPIRWRWPST
jgi:hypothetical protein